MIGVLVKNPARSNAGGVYYHDIGDYLSREEKLGIIAKFGSKHGIARADKWTTLKPNSEHDWINKRDPAFQRFIQLASKDRSFTNTIFDTSSFGVVTGRDAWVYNMSRPKLHATVRGLVDVYNTEMQKYQKACHNLPKKDWPEIGTVMDMDSKRISWTRSLKADASRAKELKFADRAIVESMYRPFTKQWLYFDRRLNEMPSLTPRLFPAARHANIAVCTTGVGNRDVFSAFVTNVLPDMHMIDKSGASQCFPLYLYEPLDDESDDKPLIDTSAEGETIDGYRRRSAVTDAILKDFQAAYGEAITKEDVFYYVYGILHSPEYRARFAADLKKMLPRIPLTKEAADYRKFTKAGRDLAQWHLNYETIDPYPLDEHSDALSLDPDKHFLVQKMTYARPTTEQKARGEKWDKTRIIYNSHITLCGIPPEALEYVVNGKPALEWIMERYQLTRDKDSGIPNDPNDWAKEHKQPRYILDLLKRVVRVSVETMRIVKSLPALNERS